MVSTHQLVSAHHLVCTHHMVSVHHLVSTHQVVSAHYLVFTHYLVSIHTVAVYPSIALVPSSPYYGASEVLLPGSENTLESDHVTPCIYRVQRQHQHQLMTVLACFLYVLL